MKALQIVKTAYRATVEEQDDTVIWFTHAMHDAGANLDVLLKGCAVNYAVANQNASGISFGAWRQTQPPRFPGEISSLINKGLSVYVAKNDIDELGIADAALIDGIRRVSIRDIATLFGEYDQIWQW